MIKQSIKTIRKEKGLTQEELSKLSGISRTIISGLENGTITNTQTSTIEAIAKALGVRTTEIFADEQ